MLYRRNRGFSGTVVSTILMSQKVKATVLLEFESGHKEAVAIPDMEVLGSWVGAKAGQSRPIYEVVHPSINGVYQHHNVGVAILDLLRVAIMELNPEWCKRGPGNLGVLAHPTKPEYVTPEMANELQSQEQRLLLSNGPVDERQRQQGPNTSMDEVDTALAEANKKDA